jgi:hypothetical protein
MDLSLDTSFLQGSEPSFLALLSIFYSVRGTDEICVNTYIWSAPPSPSISVYTSGGGGRGRGREIRNQKNDDMSGGAGTGL